MKSITIFVTEDCNLRCSYCFIDKEPREMSWETAKTSVDFLMDNSGDNKELSVCYFGGEPMLKWDLMKRVTEYAEHEASKLGKTVRFSITTNGCILPDDFIDFVYKKRRNMGILLSVDGDEEVQDRNRRTVGGQGSFHLLKRTLEELLEVERWVTNGTLRMTFTKNTTKELLRSLKYFYDLGVNNIAAIAVEEESYNEEELETLRTSFREVAQYYIQQYREGTPRYFKLFDDAIKKTISEVTRAKQQRMVTCGYGVGKVAISADGNLYPCHRMASYDKLAQVYCEGNIHSRYNPKVHTIPFEINSREVGDFCSTKPGKCDTCPIRLSCGAGCTALNYEQTGDLFTRPESSCNVRIVAYEVACEVDKVLKEEKNELYLKKFYPIKQGRNRCPGHGNK